MSSSLEGAKAGSKGSLPVEATTYGLDWRKVLFLLVVNVGFVAIGLFLMFLDPDNWLIGLACSGFFGLALLPLIGDTLKRGPLLVLDANGLWDKRMSPRPIPWLEIKDVYIRRVKLNSFVCVKIKDPKPYLPPFYSPRGFSARLNPLLLYPRMTIHTFPLQGTTSEIFSRIRRYRAQALEGDSSSRR